MRKFLYTLIIALCLLAPASAQLRVPQEVVNLVSTPVPQDIFLGALSRFRNEVLLDRDKVEPDTMTAGALMYFVPTYNAEVVRQLALLGRVPNGFNEWAHVSAQGLAKAAALYDRDQKSPQQPPPGGDPGAPRPPPQGENPGGGIAGQLRLEPGGGFVDDNGPVLPVFCHFGDAFSRWTRGQQAQVAADLDLIKAAGYDGIRFWSTLGGDNDFWRGRGVGPTTTPDYWSHLEAFLTAVRDRGLKVQFSQGDVRPHIIGDRAQFARLAAEVVRRVGPDVVALFEGANESRDTGEPDPARLAQFVQVFKSLHPNVLVGLSSFTGTEDVAIVNAFSQPPADLFIVHSYRQGHWNDRVRHVFSFAYGGDQGAPIKRVGWQGEPAGPGRLVTTMENPGEQDAAAGVLLAAMSLVTRQGFVYFSGPGVISDCQNGEVVGRHVCNGERLEQMPGFREVPQVKKAIPADVMRYDRQLIHSGDTWRSQRAFVVTGDNRADCAVYNADGRIVCVIHGSSPQTVRTDPDKRIEIFSDTPVANKGRIVYARRVS